MHRVADAGLILAGAEDTHRAREPVDEQGAGELPRLRGASAPVGHAVAQVAERGREEERERLRGLEREGAHSSAEGAMSSTLMVFGTSLSPPVV